MVRAVVFDLDGVLVDSEPVWEDVRRDVVQEYGGHWLPEAQRRLMGMSTPEWSRYLSTELGVRLRPDEVARTVVERVARCYDTHLPLLPGATEAVRRMAARWPLGLASSSPRSLVEHVLVRAQVAELFGAVVSTEQLRRGKPAPDVYLAVADALGVPAGECVAVEDSSNGVRSAAAAGARVVAVPQERYPLDPDARAHAALVLSTLDELTVEAVEALDAGS